MGVAIALVAAQNAAGRPTAGQGRARKLVLTENVHSLCLGMVVIPAAGFSLSSQRCSHPTRCRSGAGDVDGSSWKNWPYRGKALH